MRTLADFVREADRDRTPGRGPDRADLRRLAGWGEDVLRQLDRLHARGRFHGEVSPAAIRVGPRGARLLRPGDTTAPSEYRDPIRAREMLRDPEAARAATAAHDVYGVGASLYAAVEGGPPGCGHASAFTRPVPEAFAHVVYRALADGAGRYPTAAAMRDDLSRLSRLLAVGDGPVPAAKLPGFAGGTAPAPESLRPWRPRESSRRREVLVRVAVLLLLVAGGVATVLRHGPGAGAEGAPGETATANAPAAAPDPTGLPAVLDGFRDHLGELLAATGRTFDARDVPLVVVSEGPVPAGLDWPVHPSRALTERAAAALHDGVTAAEVRDAMLAAVPGDDLPAVLWLTDGRARLYYSGIGLEAEIR